MILSVSSKVQIKTTEIFEKSFAKLYKKDKHLLDELEELETPSNQTKILALALATEDTKSGFKTNQATKAKAADTESSLTQ